MKLEVAVLFLVSLAIYLIMDSAGLIGILAQEDPFLAELKEKQIKIRILESQLNQCKGVK